MISCLLRRFREPAMNDETLDFQKARASALRLLKVRPRSVAELRARLARKEFPQPVVEEVLAFLRGLGYLDDLSFANAWVRSRMNTRPRSRRSLKRELRQKGVDGGIIEQAVGAVDEDTEWDTCLSLACKRSERVRGLAPEKQRLRVAAFLQRRGYSTGLIIQALTYIKNHEKLRDSK